jgi:hypothetical protein
MPVPDPTSRAWSAWSAVTMRFRLRAELAVLLVVVAALLVMWPARGDSTAPISSGKAAPAEGGPGAVPEPYLGAWTGVASIGISGFRVVVEVTGGHGGAQIGRSYLAVSNCRFALVLVSVDPAALVADGRQLPEGNQACAERRITLNPAGDGRMTYTDSRAGAAGTLIRVS